MAAKKKTGHKIETQVVGLQYRLSRDARHMLAGHAPFKVRIEREARNFNDANALAVYTLDEPKAFHRMQLGYIPRAVASVLAPALDEGGVEIRDATVTAMNAVEGSGDLTIRLARPLKTPAN